MISQALRTAKAGAKRRAIPFSLTLYQFESIVYRAAGKCELTGIHFSYQKHSFMRNPWGASIDRIDSKRGYTFPNCRLVCSVVNMAMNEWGLDVLLKIAQRLYTKQKLELLEEGSDHLSVHEASAFCGLKVGEFKRAYKEGLLPEPSWFSRPRGTPIPRWDKNNLVRCE